MPETGRQKDISGMRFGKLTALEPSGERKNGYTVWRCSCDCGNEIFVSSRHLKNGWAQDCGCVPKEKKAAADRDKKASARVRIKDWVGKSFGDLQVTAYDGKRGGKHYWRCLCVCGKETVVSQSNLQDGHTRSCGCKVNPAGTRHFVDGTCIESIRSRRISVSNSSGIRGVYKNKRTGRWAAQITFQGKTRYLGSYDSLEEAAKAREKAEEIFDEFLEKYDRERPGPEAGRVEDSAELLSEFLKTCKETFRRHEMEEESFPQLETEEMKQEREGKKPETKEEKQDLPVRSGHGKED